MDILSNDYVSQNVMLDATHSMLKMRLAEIRMDKRWTIGQVKSQLERRFGSAVEDMKVELKNAAGATICILDDDNLTLE